MTIATKTTITLPSNLRKSSTRGPSRAGRPGVRLAPGRWAGRTRRCGWVGASGATTRPVPAVPVIVTAVPLGMSIGRRRAELVGLALGLDEDAPEPAGRDRDRDRRRARRRGSTSRTGSSPSDRRRTVNITNTIPNADEPADRADDRGRAGVQVEDLGREQPAHAEHRDEPEEERHQRHAADVEADVERVEDAAEDVVDEDGDQQQAAADQRADDEDQILDRDDHPAPPPRRPAGRPSGQGYDAAGRRGGRGPAGRRDEPPRRQESDQPPGPKRSDSHDSRGVWRSACAPSRTDAEPGAPSTGAGHRRVEGERDLVRRAEPVARAWMRDVLGPDDELDLALERLDLGGERGVVGGQLGGPVRGGRGVADLAGEDDDDPDRDEAGGDPADAAAGDPGDRQPAEVDRGRSRAPSRCSASRASGRPRRAPSDARAADRSGVTGPSVEAARRVVHVSRVVCRQSTCQLVPRRDNQPVTSVRGPSC